MSPNRSEVTAILQRTALLSSLSRAEIESLAALTVVRHFSNGELLFSEDKPCNGLHIVASGKVRIFKTSVSGREQVLAINQAGESVAELPVFDGGNFPASAMAIEPAEIAFISRADFKSFCLQHPEVALKMLAVVGGRLRRLVAIIEELSFTTIRQRIIALLLRLADTEGRQTPRGIEFQLPVSHQELASQLGTVRELISRNLTRLQAEGLLEVNARQIVVRDRAALTTLVATTDL
jgi:CRP/FNR family transcriptional regulator